MDEPRSAQSVSEGDEALSAQIAHLKMEVKFNEKLADQFKKEYLKGQEALQAQARYIGHIETNLAQLGGKSDQTFLAAPVPSSERSRGVREQTDMTPPSIIQKHYPHPNQSHLHTG